MYVNTEKGGSKAANPFGVNFHLLSGANVSPVIDVQTFLAVIVVVILRINTIENLNYATLHANQ